MKKGTPYQNEVPFFMSKFATDCEFNLFLLAARAALVSSDLRLVIGL